MLVFRQMLWTRVGKFLTLPIVCFNLKDNLFPPSYFVPISFFDAGKYPHINAKSGHVVFAKVHVVVVGVLAMEYLLLWH